MLYILFTILAKSLWIQYHVSYIANNRILQIFASFKTNVSYLYKAIKFINKSLCLKNLTIFNWRIEIINISNYISHKYLTDDFIAMKIIYVN